MNIGILESILCVLIAVLLVTAFFRQLRLSIILGYLLVGMLVGPHTLHLIPNSDTINQIAEFGIVFLMFTIGLEFSIPKLFTLKHAVLFIGIPQVLLSIMITALIGVVIGMTTLSAVIVGGIVAMSSTAIVIKQLHDQNELHTTHGMNALGILLLQDVAVIPFMIFIASMKHQASAPFIEIVLIAAINGVLALLIIYFVGKKLLRPLFRLIAKTNTLELFTLAVLLVTLTSAWLTHILGLSYALGAFLAGIMLSETEFKNQIETEIRPFRDILLGLFFISIGMLADMHSWLATWPWILLLLVAIIIGKMLLIIFLSRLSGYPFKTAVRTGLILSQAGEFSFAILNLALIQNLLPPDYDQVILAALLISILFSPLLIHFNGYIASHRKK